MYIVYLDDDILYSPDLVSQGRIIFDATLEKEIDSVDSFTFSILNTNSFYDKILLYKSTIKISSMNTETKKETFIFVGRPIAYEIDFYGTATFTCEGALGYLNDEIGLDYGEEIGIDTTVKNFVNLYIQDYNKYRKSGRTFAVSYQYSAIQYMKNSDQEAVFDEATSYLDILLNYIENVPGLHVSTRYDNNLQYIYFINSNSSLENNVPIDTIEFGKNLQDISLTSNMDDAFSVVIPLGSYTHYLDPVNGMSEAPNRFKLNSPKYDGTSSPYVSDRIESQVLINRIGYIVKYVIFDYVSDLDSNPWQILHNAGTAVLTSYENIGITVKSVKIDPSIVVNIGDTIEIKDPYRRVTNGKYMVTKISFPLDDPSGTEYELNFSGYKSLSRNMGYQSKYLTKVGQTASKAYKFIPKNKNTKEKAE